MNNVIPGGPDHKPRPRPLICTLYKRYARLWEKVSMTDLLTHPEAQTVNPAEARRIAQMQAEIARLQPTPKKSTTSYCITADSSMSTPTRTSDIEDRRRLVAQMAPTVDSVQSGWDAAEARWAARSAAYEREQADIQAQLRANDEARLAAVNRELTRQKKVQEFRAAETTRELALGHLTNAEKGRVNQQALDAGKFDDIDYLMYLAQIEVAARESRPVRDNPPLDWRGIITAKRK